MQLSRADIQELYERYGHTVYRRCRSLLRDEEEAYDAMQEVFVRLITHADQFRGEASPLTWLYRTSTNLCLNRIRDHHARARKLADPDPAADTLPGMSAFSGIDPERRHLVASLLRKADASTRAILIYYYMDGMTLDEVSAVMGISVPTLRKRIRRFQKAAGKSFGKTVLSACLLVLLGGGTTGRRS